MVRRMKAWTKMMEVKQVTEKTEETKETKTIGKTKLKHERTELVNTGCYVKTRRVLKV